MMHKVKEFEVGLKVKFVSISLTMMLFINSNCVLPET